MPYLSVSYGILWNCVEYENAHTAGAICLWVFLPSRFIYFRDEIRERLFYEGIHATASHGRHAG